MFCENDILIATGFGEYKREAPDDSSLVINPECRLQTSILATSNLKEYGWGVGYGGQMMGQALVHWGCSCASFHAHFLRAGDTKTKHSILEKEESRRQVMLVQSQEKVYMSRFVGSCFKPWHSQPGKKWSIEEVAFPEINSTILSLSDWYMPQFYQNRAFAEYGLKHQAYFKRGQSRQIAYVQLLTPLLSQTMHQAVLSYACDSLFASPVVLRHGLYFWSGGKTKFMSFSCSFYFFGNVNVNHGVKMTADCSKFIESRALVTIEFHDLVTHEWVAFAVQEVLVYENKPK